MENKIKNKIKIMENETREIEMNREPAEDVL